MAFKHKDAHLCKQNHLTVSFYDICLINLFMSFRDFDMLISLTFQVSLDRKCNVIFLFFHPLEAYPVYSLATSFRLFDMFLESLYLDCFGLEVLMSE